jgi:hypothetical protein
VLVWLVKRLLFEKKWRNYNRLVREINGKIILFMLRPYR